MFDREPPHRAEHWVALLIFLVGCWAIGVNPLVLVGLGILVLVALVIAGVR